VKYVHQFRDWVFQVVHTNNLIYNTCWEDPRCDRELLGFNKQSQIVMITSAGCNALDYLLDEPAAIHCVDMNPRQNALLELKRATLAHTDFVAHTALFGKGRHQEIHHLYQDKLRHQLPGYAQEIWDQHITSFSGKGGRKSFYDYGTSGVLAWLLRGYFKTRPRLLAELRQLFISETLEAQQTLYSAIEPRLINQLVHWAVNRHLTMCLVGVPRSQQELFRGDYERGVTGFLQACLRRVFTTQLIKDNYFWQLYFHGKYPDNCHPNYLQETHFDQLHESVDRISQHNTTVTNFLQENPAPYSHYILLDHQDWLADNDQQGLEDEWRAILQNSQTGTKILLRSAAERVDFIPAFVHERVAFVPTVDLAASHAADRVGTYASVHLGIVK